MELKRHQVHMLPTEEKTDIIFVTRGSMNELRYVPTLLKEGLTLLDKEFKPQHLYFTTDEEIKEGDKIFWEGKIYDYREFMSMKTHVYTNYGKIIATTDPELYLLEIDEVGIESKFSLPQPSQALIKAYCEQGGFDEVDVEYELNEGAQFNTDNSNPLRWDKSPMKLKVDPEHNTITTHRIVEKMYSLDEMKKMWIHLGEQGWGDSSGEGFDKWIKENLKQ